MLSCRAILRFRGSSWWKLAIILENGATIHYHPTNRQTKHIAHTCLYYNAEYMIYLDFTYIYICMISYMYSIESYIYIYKYIDVTLILMWTFATARCILYHCTDHGPRLHFCLQVGTGEVSSQFEWYHPPLQAADVAANFSACDRQNRGWLRNLTETYGDNKVLSCHIFKCAHLRMRIDKLITRCS